MYFYYFEKLEVFKRSKSLVAEIYKITKDFPDEEKFSLVNQIRRAAVSIMANIAEGNSRVTKKDQAHFTSLSYSSAMELLSLLMASVELSFLEDSAYRKIRSDIEVIAKQLVSLRKSQLK